MKIGRFILIAGAVGISWVVGKALKTGAAILSTDFQFNKIESIGYEGNFPEGNVILKLSVQGINPTPFEVTCESISVKITDADKNTPIAQIDWWTANLKLQANNISRFTIPVSIQTNTILRLVAEAAGTLISGKNDFLQIFPKRFRVKGFVKMQNVLFPINQVVTL